MPYIIGGEKKGFKLLSVGSSKLRPVPSKVKEAIFSKLSNCRDLETIELLDLFAGTGSFGLEALSRGAKRALFIELDKKIYTILIKNIENLGYRAKSEAWKKDAFRFIRSTTRSFDLIYVAPPQFRDLCFLAARDIFLRPNLLKPQGILIFQIDKREDLGIEPTYFRILDDRIYGDSRVLFYEKI